ncbi:MAG TPA: universal stress protein [Alphaproteobacteria bacterium]|nr:universal stress protein [Alphaproteobacteria bacterium]
MTAEAKASPSRSYLVIVDRSAELNVALRYACRGARQAGGRVALLCVIEPVDGAGWLAVEALAQSESRQEAEEKLQELSAKVVEWTGLMPVIYIREGQPLEEILKLIDEDPSISLLILGADPGPQGPGPLVSALSSKQVAKLRVPLTIVPGNLTDEQIDLLA